MILPDSRGHGRSTNPGGLSYAQIADDVAALIAALGLIRPVVGGWSDGGQASLELGARHPGVAGALIVGAAYPDFAGTGLRDAHRGALLGADEAGVPDLEQLDAQLGDDAGVIKSWHPGGPQQWRTLVQQTAPMWLDYDGLSPGELQAIETPVLVLAGDRDELIPLDLSISLYRALPRAELAICPQADHGGPMTPERAAVFASLIRDFARRHATA